MRHNHYAAVPALCGMFYNAKAIEEADWLTGQDIDDLPAPPRVAGVRLQEEADND